MVEDTVKVNGLLMKSFSRCQKFLYWARLAARNSLADADKAIATSNLANVKNRDSAHTTGMSENTSGSFISGIMNAGK